MVVCIQCGQQHNDEYGCAQHAVRMIQVRADKRNMTGKQMAAIGLLQTLVDRLFEGIEQTFPADEVFAIRSALLDVSELTEIQLESITE